MRPILALISLITLTQPALALKLEVHEWGTFTSLVGSNGITQNGMYHEDEQLPSFVHPFGEIAKDPTTLPPAKRPSCPPYSKICMDRDFINAQTITQKMETPVLYFRSDVNQDVTVNVKFPKGVVTETYPAPVATSPTRDSITSVENGDTTFKVKVMPQFTGNEVFDMPIVSEDNIYGHARAAKADYVRSGDEVDKFIFYRGVGQYNPLFSLKSKGSDLTISAPSHTPQVSYLIDVANDGDARLMKITFRSLRSGVRIGGYQIAALRQHHLGAVNSNANDFGSIVANEQASSEIVNGLVQAGLHMDEAQAMVATWERGYLKVPGLRLLSILPREEVDSILPLTITPAPTSLERVFVSRIEILLDSEEQQILSEIEKEGDKYDIAKLGRFAEPKLHRIYEVCRAAGKCNFCGETATRVTLDTLIKRAQNPDEQSGSTTIQ